MSGIEDALWRLGYLSSGENLRITHKANRDGWARAECPKCGYERAQVHDGRGLFWCPKVNKMTGEACLKIAVRHDWSAVAQFAEMIVKVNGNASVRKYGEWLQPMEVAQVCEECLLHYDRDGDLDKWEADLWQQAEAGLIDAKSVPDKLRAYVFKALRGDVLNYARDKTRRIRRGQTPDVEYAPGNEAMASATAAPWETPSLIRTGPRSKAPGIVTYTDQEGMPVVERRHDLPPGAAKRVAEAEAEYSADIDSEYPVLTMHELWGMSQAEIARALHCNVRQVKYRLAQERERIEVSAKARKLIS